MKSHIYACSAFCWLSVCLPCGAQAPRVQQQDLIQQLQSSDPLRRADAFSALYRKPGVWGEPGMASVLVRLLDRENQLLISTLRESNGRDGVAVKYGEGFSEYYASLLEACNQHCDKQDPKTIEVLASGAYGASSPFAKELARKYGTQVLPLMLDKSRSDMFGHRHDAIIMLGRIAGTAPGLSAEQRARIHGAVVARAADENIDVRLVAVRTLSAVGTADDLPLLNQIAEHDPVRNVNHGVVTYPVRAEARNAIARIPKR